MKITMVMVASVDGKTTRGEKSSIYEWTSVEDQQFFFSKIKKAELIVMGSKTYIDSKQIIKLTPKTLRVVLTHSPEKYKNDEVAEQLEFSSETPSRLVERLEKDFKELLLVGGATINKMFLQEKLVNELFLTIEPKMIGKGNPIVDNAYLDLKLKLKSAKHLNDQGTLLLHYKILY